MGEPSEDRPVLVAVSNPDHVRQLVRTASDLARVGTGYIKIVSVVVKPPSSPFSMYTDETIIEQFAQDSQDILDAASEIAPRDVRVEREISVHRTVADGILSVLEHTGSETLVIGWHRRRPSPDVILGTNLDRLIKYAPCDIYVERIGFEANGVDSILVPVAGGPHVRPAAAAAKAIAARNDARVTVIAVVEAGDEPESAHEDVETAVQLLEDAPGPAVEIETEIQKGESVSGALLDAAPAHDVLIFGVTRQSAIRRRLVGSIPQTVIPQTDRTVILARSKASFETPWLEQLRQFWRRT